jgi:propanediol dehydratase large subunit
MFGPSNWNAEDIDDYLVMQRDWGVDGGLRTVAEKEVEGLRKRATEAVSAVYTWLGLGDLTAAWAEQAVYAAGSKDIEASDLMLPLTASATIMNTNITMLDVIAALAENGFDMEAERCLDMLKARVAGDYLQTAAIFDEKMNVLSMVTDPNDYAGPGTGYKPSAQRQAEIDTIRQQVSVADLRVEQNRYRSADFRVAGSAEISHDPRDVVIGVSPATGRDIWRTLCGMLVSDVLDELLAGLEEEGCIGRVVRMNDSIDLGVIGLGAARMSGTGIGIGLQAKGTALIHRRELAPLANLELYSVAPSVTPSLYRLMGINAGRYAKGMTPEPVRNPYSDEAIEARYHTKVVALVAIERECCSGGVPELLEIVR